MKNMYAPLNLNTFLYLLFYSIITDYGIKFDTYDVDPLNPYIHTLMLVLWSNLSSINPKQYLLTQAIYDLNNSSRIENFWWSQPSTEKHQPVNLSSWKNDQIMPWKNHLSSGNSNWVSYSVGKKYIYPQFYPWHFS